MCRSVTVEVNEKCQSMEIKEEAWNEAVRAGEFKKVYGTVRRAERELWLWEGCCLLNGGGSETWMTSTEEFSHALLLLLMSVKRLQNMLSLSNMWRTTEFVK